MDHKNITQYNTAKMIIFSTFILSLVYVVLRYHIFGGVEWREFPLFILNKAMALAGFLLVTYNFSFGPFKNIGIKIPDSWMAARNILAMTGFLFLLIHAFISFLLFSPAHYGKFFEAEGTLTLIAGMSMLSGVIGFVLLWMMNITFQSFMRENDVFVAFIGSRKFLLWALTLGGLHILLMGYNGWMHPEGWHGGIPPVSLVAFVFFTVGYIANVLGRK
jgi:DMSO/TMAO reductase YedYZ heme-binding membrane subunit